MSPLTKAVYSTQRGPAKSARGGSASTHYVEFRCGLNTGLFEKIVNDCVPLVIAT